MPSKTTGMTRVAGAKVGKAAGRGTTRDLQAAQGASLQIIRKEGKVALLSHLADLEALGDITSEPEEFDDYDSSDADTDSETDSEIDLADSDLNLLEGWDNQSDHSFEPAFSRGSASALPSIQIESAAGFELIILKGRCQFHRPLWRRCRPRTEKGQKHLDEIVRRFCVLSEMANWLSLNRPEFLLNPDPWNLSIHALKEMKSNYVSVSPGSLLGVTKIGGLDANSSDLFSRHISNCSLVWAGEGGALPLCFIFGSQARMAWVANAVLQYAFSHGNMLTESDLDTYRNVTVPRSTSDRAALFGRPVDSLDFGDFISKANMMAGTKWSDVLSTHETKLFQT